MNKVLLITITLLAVLLAGCSSDLPPDPGSPGLSGNYYRAIGDWATQPDTFSFGGPDVFQCSDGEVVRVDYDVSGDDYVYKKMYLWIESESGWESVTFEGEQVPNSNWIRGDAEWGVEVECSELMAAVDDNNELFAVAYTCSRNEDQSWDCNDDRWQLEIINATQKELLPPEPKQPGTGDNNSLACTDSDGGKDIFTKGTTRGVWDMYSEDSTDVSTHYDGCRYNLGKVNGLPAAVGEYYCDNNDRKASEMFPCEYGCVDGACLESLATNEEEP